MNEPQIVKLLTANGLKPVAARVLACWHDDEDELTAVDIENMSSLRQPEVSIATTYLTERGWLSIRQQRSGGRGRPINLYRLAMPMSDIIQEIVADRTREIDRALATANALLRAVA